MISRVLPEVGAPPRLCCAGWSRSRNWSRRSSRYLEQEQWQELKQHDGGAGTEIRAAGAVGATAGRKVFCIAVF